MTSPSPDTGPRPAHTGPRVASVEVVVIGGGVVGAATAWQLARRGRDVLVLERFEVGHSRGESHGTSRLYRQGHADPAQVQLAVEALHRWRELEHETGAALLNLTGGLEHGDPDRVEALAASLAAHGIRYDWLEPDEAVARWPGMRFRGRVLHQPDRSGRLRAGQSLAALTAAAIGRGATIRHCTPVDRIEVLGPDLVEVGTPGGPVRARRVVVAAGVWTASLVGSLIDLPPLLVTREQRAVFPARGSTGCAPRDVDWPVFVHHNGAAGNLHGVPGAGEGVRVGFSRVGPRRDPSLGGPVRPAMLDRLQEYVARHLPGLDPDRPTPLHLTFASAPDDGFVLESAGPLVVAAGFGGRAFTYGPALGRIVADLVSGRAEPELPRPRRRRRVRVVTRAGLHAGAPPT